jgi:[protein-PII] uridylyltransferase
MQAYFRHATAVGDLTRIFLTALDGACQGRAPLLGLFRRRPTRAPATRNPEQGRLAIADPEAFLSPIR